MRAEYDIVVVGSGYGAGVAASRMARAGKTVAVLELGEEKWPGEYPIKLKEASQELHTSGNAGGNEDIPKEVEIGKRTGMYHLVLGQGQDVFVGNGNSTPVVPYDEWLGGTSLINANVFLPADHRTLQLSAWPPEIRKNPSALDSYYKRAANMLTPIPYPKTYSPLKKLNVLEKQAEAISQERNFYRVPQTTFFHDGLNNAGVEMKASTGSGQDCTGINDGSKNTVLVTYLADAWNWGAEIFCECEVRYVQKDKRGKGYTVHFAWHSDGRKPFNEDQMGNLLWVRAKEICVLGAGTLGTTSILLRSQKRGLKTSPLVGQKLSGNGDILGFTYNSDNIINSVGKEPPDSSDPPGPTITGVIDARDPKSSPNVLDGYVIQEGAIPEALAPLIQIMLEGMPGEIRPEVGNYNALRRLWSSAKSRIFGPYVQDGSINRTQTFLVMSHDNNEAILTLAGDKPYLQFAGVGRTKQIGQLRDVLARASNVIGATFVNVPLYRSMKKEVTAHPLGGAVMSSDGTGRCGAVDHMGRVFIGEGTEVYDDLFCVDASVIPTSLSANPLATITALAERTCDLFLHEKNWKADEAPNGRLNLFGRPKIAHESPEWSVDFARTGVDNPSVRFTELMNGYVHIGNDIIDIEVAHSIAKGSASSASLLVTVDVLNQPDVTSVFDYTSRATGTFCCGALSRSPLMILDGRIDFFSTDEHVSDGKNLVYKLTLSSVEGETYQLHGRKIIDSAIAFSATRTWKATTTLYTTITNIKGALVGCVAEDGVQTTIKVWEPVTGSCNRHMPILFLPGASVDDQVFSLPTVPTNTIDYFTQLGYTCYVATLRFGIVHAARLGFTAYDARFDVRAAMEFVRKEEGDKKFYVVCHCLGSIAMGMALLTGVVDSEWIQGMTCSQVFTHLRFGQVNRLKARTQLLEKVYNVSESPFNVLITTQLILIFAGIGCNFFDGIHMSFLSHLTLMGSTPPHHLRSNLSDFTDLVTEPGNLERMRGLKIQFLSGGANVVYDPWSTSEIYDLLRHEFGTEDYERVVVAGYRHLDTWMGKDSYKDVYPRVKWFVEKCERYGDQDDFTFVG
ncbi:hypothetical protein N0V90_001831 [Kalmusia sp. IMI 367209]|nr:hypothetical protein N0V90_001831 [Kalmusia sp. IMI 367209]